MKFVFTVMMVALLFLIFAVREFNSGTIIINLLPSKSYEISKSILVVPTSKIKLIPHIADSKVLEVAIMGKCDVLVTGDKKHLLLLKSFQGVAIESPSHFLKRLKTLKGS